MMFYGKRNINLEDKIPLKADRSYITTKTQSDLSPTDFKSAARSITDLRIVQHALSL